MRAPTAFFVYAKRPGHSVPRPLAGPFTTRDTAMVYQSQAETIGVRRHLVSTHSDAVYVGPSCPEVAGRVGLLNQWLGLPAVRAEA